MMQMTMRHGRVIAAAIVATLTSCASNWDRYPDSLYAVLREESAASVKAHHALLGKLINVGDGAPRPGLAAEYAYYSWKLGRDEEARMALQKEREHYPQSTRFLEVFENFLPSVPRTAGIEQEAGS